tara:strand:+ start:1340 stop:2218 length:879 start_codon:yes stop_codon:yes gene_type:complete
VHTACINKIFDNTEIKAIIVSGPDLTPLPFLTNCIEYSLEHNIPVYSYEDITDSDIVKISKETDVGISVGFGSIIRKNQFTGPAFGIFNLHPSKLPAYRGMHPIIYGMMNGESSLGITLHRIDSGLDTGPIIAQSTELVTSHDSVRSMTDKVYTKGAALIDQLLHTLAEKGCVPEMDQTVYDDLLDTRRIIRWNDSAWRINNLIRSLSYPWPMAKTFFQSTPILIGCSNIIHDNKMVPGLILDICPDYIKVGTGGHSITIGEIRDENKNIVPIPRFRELFNPIPMESCFEDL